MRRGFDARRRDLLRGLGSALVLLQAGDARAADATAAARPRATAAPRATDELCYTSATVLGRLLRTKRLSARELMAAHLRRIERLNPRLKALVAMLPPEQCLALADAADAQLARGETPGPLHGLPTAFEDLQPAVGFPNTRGSPLFRDARSPADSVLVERLRAAGALGIAMTNVPEFGMGSHTYNAVYGTTLNPWNLAKSAGGSSGGAAAALAAGLLPIADGSDLGGSLRNPASFNNVVALRPTVGIVPLAPNPLPFLGFAVAGPMARTVPDLALLMSVMAGADARDPASVPGDPRAYRRPLERAFDGVRVAWCPDLGDLPLDPAVRAVLDAQRRTFESLGCRVEPACPDLSGVEDIFVTLRAWRSWLSYRDLLAQHRDALQPEAIAEIEAGSKLTADDVGRAMLEHARLLERVRRFQQDYPFLVCTVSQVPPFDATETWPRSVDGVPMPHYIEWMRSAWAITTTWCPAAAVPAGFTPDGLPVGLQIVGRPRDDFGVLQLAHAFEQATQFGRRRPPLPA
jgi:amidase